MVKIKFGIYDSGFSQALEIRGDNNLEFRPLESRSKRGPVDAQAQTIL